MKHIAIARRTIIYVVLICILIVGAVGWMSWNARANRLREVAQIADSKAGIAAQQTQDALQIIGTVLQGLGKQATSYGIDPAALAEIMNSATADIASAPQIIAIFVFDEHGNLRASTMPPIRSGVNVADREYFVYHRTHVDAGMHINEPIVSRVMGQHAIPVTIRVNQRDGSFGGVIVADINTSFQTKFYEHLNLGPDSAANLFLDNGILLTRWPPMPEAVGTSMKETPLFQAMLAGGSEGSMTLRSTMDGIAHVISYRRLEQYPIFVAVGIAEDEALAAWRRDTITHLALGLLVSAVIGTIGMRLAQQIRLRGEAEADLFHANQTLKELAMKDDLTGLANRRHFDSVFKVELNRAQRYDHPLALMLLDVDHFKQYNDRYGHLLGDQCLKLIAQTICAAGAKRPCDLVARYGGEEFVVLQPEIDLDGAMFVAEEMRRAVQALGIEQIDNPAGVATISIGVHVWHPWDEATDGNALLAKADSALYQAKTDGRNRVSNAPMQ
jgi:diguanylate cyclase (GGDEF)-like protein